MLHSHDVQFNESEKNSNVVSSHHVILDFSMDCESEALNESQNPNKSAPEPVLRRSTKERCQPKSSF